MNKMQRISVAFIDVNSNLHIEQELKIRFIYTFMWPSINGTVWTKPIASNQRKHMMWPGVNRPFVIYVRCFTCPLFYYSCNMLGHILTISLKIRRCSISSFYFSGGPHIHSCPISALKSNNRTLLTPAWQCHGGGPRGTSGDRNVLKTVWGRPPRDIDWRVAVLPHSVPVFSSTSDFCPPLYVSFYHSLWSFSFSRLVSSQVLRTVASVYSFFACLTLCTLFLSFIHLLRIKNVNAHIHTQNNRCPTLIKTQLCLGESGKHEV